jgi:hypothetical protein
MAAPTLVPMSLLVTTPTHSGGSEILQRFHPAVSVWFERRFGDGPTEAQARGWRAIIAGRHTLVCAPTGSGKTLAGFLSAIDALYHAHGAGNSIEGATQVVYLSPLKALAADIHAALEARGLIRGGHFVTGVTGEQFAEETTVPLLRRRRVGRAFAQPTAQPPERVDRPSAGTDPGSTAARAVVADGDG